MNYINGISIYKYNMFSSSREHLIPLNQHPQYLDESYIDVIENSHGDNNQYNISPPDYFFIPISKKIKVNCIYYIDCCRYGYDSLTITQKSVIFVMIFIIILILVVWP